MESTVHSKQSIRADRDRQEMDETKSKVKVNDEGSKNENESENSQRSTGGTVENETKKRGRWSEDQTDGPSELTDTNEQGRHGTAWGAREKNKIKY